jgi:hypothetical protein
MDPRVGSVACIVKLPEQIGILLLLAAVVYLSAGWAAAGAGDPTDLPILQKWSGDYLVAHLDRLPQGKSKAGVGYIDDKTLFEGVWEIFKPGEPLPEVDFGTQIVVFYRNVTFYNRTNIVKITLRDGIAEIIAIETRSALPIEDKVAMAMVVIPRAGVKFIQAGNERIPVPPVQ